MTTRVDRRSQDFAFLPFCSIAQAFQAQGIVRYNWRAIIKPIIHMLMDYDVNIVQMPCPESLFGGLDRSLIREPQSLKNYDNDQFRQHCQQLAEGVIRQIAVLQASGYRVLVILGVEYSPSCSVVYQYTNRGTERNPGIFIQELSKRLSLAKLDIPMLGINRRGIGPTMRRLKEILTKQIGVLDLSVKGRSSGVIKVGKVND